jgi:hypothetical protein
MREWKAVVAFNAMTFRFCPHCGEELRPEASAVAATSTPPESRAQRIKSYDQTAYWAALRERVTVSGPLPGIRELVAELVRDIPVAPSSPQPSIVHLIFDRPVTPSGGALLQTVLSNGRLGPARDPEQLARRGYVLEDRTVRQKNGVPIGRAYLALDHWGGARQHPRWHLVEPITLEPSRHGDPFFMDEHCLAFGAKWRDLDRFSDAMTALLEAFRLGFDGSCIGNPLVIDVFWAEASSRE